MAVNRFSVRIICDGIDLDESFVLGDQPASVSEGYGGQWDILERPRRVGLPYWTGKPPIQLSIPIVVGSIAEDQGVGVLVNKLELLANRGRGAESGPSEPFQLSTPVSSLIPFVQTHGAKDPEIDAWVCNGLEISDQHYNAAGRLVQAFVTITALQYFEDVSFEKAAKQLKKKAKKTASKTHKWKSGDTVHKLATKYYGSDAAKYVKKIKEANSSVKNWTSVKAGTSLRIPSKD